MKFLLRCVGKPKNKHLKAVSAEYEKRIQSYLPLEIREVKEGTGRSDEVKKSEFLLLTQSLPSDAVWVSMDERGASLTSREFADFIEKNMIQGTRYVVFFIGGAAGLDPEIFEKSTRLTLSSMTLTHEMARALLTEQIYRAMTIIRNEPYHKD